SELMSGARIRLWGPLVAMAWPSLVVMNCSRLASYLPVAGLKKFRPVASSVYELVMARPRSSTVTLCQIRWCGPDSTITGRLVAGGKESCGLAHKGSTKMAPQRWAMVFIGD